LKQQLSTVESEKEETEMRLIEIEAERSVITLAIVCIRMYIIINGFRVQKYIGKELTMLSINCNT